jgi:hypothetical protein
MANNLRPKYTTLVGLILFIIGFAYMRITGNGDVIVMGFGILLGIILFLVGLAGMASEKMKKKKEGENMQNMQK